MFRKLLVPLDRSSLAEQALGQSAAIARASKATVELLLVQRPVPLDILVDAPSNAQRWTAAEEYLDSVAAELTSGAAVSVTYAVLRGEPIEMICRRIDDVNADLVVMTSHGRTGLARAWLGSVADGVLRRSTVPVLMLRPIEGRTRRDAERQLFKRLLIPVDGSERSLEVFAAAASLAKCGDGAITLLRVVQPIPIVLADAGFSGPFMPTLVDEPMTKRLAGEAREQLADLARRLHEETGLEIEASVIVEPHVATAIVEFARGHATDAIAMTTHGRGMSRLLIGSVADKVLRGASLPMLLYRPLGVDAARHSTAAAAELAPASD